jgi:hypothetical protein
VLSGHAPAYPHFRLRIASHPMPASVHLETISRGSPNPAPFGMQGNEPRASRSDLLRGSQAAAVYKGTSRRLSGATATDRSALTKAEIGVTVILWSSEQSRFISYFFHHRSTGDQHVYVQNLRTPRMQARQIFFAL